jgi:hypothetical protein
MKFWRLGVESSKGVSYRSFAACGGVLRRDRLAVILCSIGDDSIDLDLATYPKTGATIIVVARRCGTGLDEIRLTMPGVASQRDLDMSSQKRTKKRKNGNVQQPLTNGR